MEISEKSNTPPATSVLFARGVIARLAIWPALRIAVEQGWGGPEGTEKRTWLASVIVDAFEEQNPTPDAIYLEDTLLQVMEDEFETTLEDSSAEVVAQDIVGLWDHIHLGKQDMVLRLEELAEKLKGKKTNVQGTNEEVEMEDDDDDFEDDSDNDQAPELLQHDSQPEVDEDGFTTVKSKGKSRR